MKFYEGGQKIMEHYKFAYEKSGKVIKFHEGGNYIINNIIFIIILILLCFQNLSFE